MLNKIILKFLEISKIIKYKEMLTQNINNKSNNNCFKKQQDNLNVAKIALIKTNTD